MRRVRPLAVSPIHSSMALAVVLVKANCLPSGLQTGAPSFAAPGGAATGISDASDSRFMVYLVLENGRCGPLLWMSMRSPARRNMGCATSAIGG